MKLVTILKRESMLTLAREALWRSQKRWRQAHFRRNVQHNCPVRYHPLGYYQFRPGTLEEPSCETIFRYADAICGGKFPGLAYNPVALGLPPPWNVDFISGHAWPSVPAEKITVIRQDGSDIKVPWELSRLQFLPVMGKAWCLSRDERYRSAAKQLLLHWIKNNPVGHGVNWVIAMEAALRAISICLFLEFMPARSAVEGWWREITRSLWQHLIFIEAHLEFSHFARGNHYLSNIVGLFCLSSFLQGPGMRKRRNSYQKLIEKEMLLQVYRDGVDYEASTGYHLLNLQMFTLAFLLMRRQQLPINEGFQERLNRMYGFLAELGDCQGRIAHIGDCDDGRVELLSDDLEQMFVADVHDRHSLNSPGVLGIGQGLFNESYGGHKRDAVWYGLPEIEDRSRSSQRSSTNIVLFPESGIAVADANQLRLVFLAMPNGMKGKGTHTHNDKLSVIASFAGKPLFVDAGTGCYTRNPHTRNYFRSTAAHNTIQIDNQEQNRFSTSASTVFVIGDDAQVTPITINETEESSCIYAAHNGYQRLGVIHQREVQLSSASILTINDYLEGAGYHRFELQFHLSQQWQIHLLQDKGNEVKCRIRDDSTLLELTSAAAVELEMSCATTELSPAYGLVTVGNVLAVRGTWNAAALMVTSLLTPIV